jgi:hypothetical protein
MADHVQRHRPDQTREVVQHGGGFEQRVQRLGLQAKAGASQEIGRGAPAEGAHLLPVLALTQRR